MEDLMFENQKTIETTVVELSMTEDYKNDMENSLARLEDNMKKIDIYSDALEKIEDADVIAIVNKVGHEGRVAILGLATADIDEEELDLLVGHEARKLTMAQKILVWLKDALDKVIILLREGLSRFVSYFSMLGVDLTKVKSRIEDLDVTATINLSGNDKDVNVIRKIENRLGLFMDKDYVKILRKSFDIKTVEKDNNISNAVHLLSDLARATYEEVTSDYLKDQMADIENNGNFRSDNEEAVKLLDAIIGSSKTPLTSKARLVKNTFKHIFRVSIIPTNTSIEVFILGKSKKGEKEAVIKKVDYRHNTTRKYPTNMDLTRADLIDMCDKLLDLQRDFDISATTSAVYDGIYAVEKQLNVLEATMKNKKKLARLRLVVSMFTKANIRNLNALASNISDGYKVLNLLVDAAQ